MLIDGESGTGKELMAKVIHANGERADRPFVSVNCGAIPDNLLESELFGHCKGAFTGASGDRKGKFESAHTGTIFLDEIGELPLSGQVKLLRVLEAHEIQRVGSDEPIAVDARVVAATNRNLRKLCEEGRFREDLFYRLSVIHITLPPLRERKDEIPLLFEFFGDEAAEALKRRPIEMSAAPAPVPAGLRLPGQHPGAAQHHLPALVPGRADGRPGAPARGHPARAAGSGCAAPRAGGDGHAAGPAALGEAKRAASDQAEREFLERGLARGRRRGDRTGQALRHEPVPCADAAEEARHPVQGLPQREHAAPRAGCHCRLDAQSMLALIHVEARIRIESGMTSSTTSQRTGRS